MAEEDHIINEAMKVFRRAYEDIESWQHLDDCIREALRYAVRTAQEEMY